ncbi:MAG: hypothetical protein M3Z24_03020 [Chloroflexota bacterium]|nr:hypothetical protein [Chloroflexota bacterium]
MGKRDARLFQQGNPTSGHNWNIVELESHRLLRQKINELIELSYSSTLTTSEIRKQMLHSVATFGKKFATQLVRSLQRDDPEEREAIIWLLTVLNDTETIPLLQQMSHNTHLPRSVRFSASLARAGMGATAEMQDNQKRIRLYAI